MIPFKKLGRIETLQGSLSLKTALQPLINKEFLSTGTLLELRKEFKFMQENDLLKEICTILDTLSLDMQSQMNHAPLLFSTGKVQNYSLWVLKNILKGLCQDTFGVIAKSHVMFFTKRRHKN